MIPHERIVEKVSECLLTTGYNQLCREVDGWLKSFGCDRDRKEQVLHLEETSALAAFRSELLSRLPGFRSSVCVRQTDRFGLCVMLWFRNDHATVFGVVFESASKCGNADVQDGVLCQRLADRVVVVFDSDMVL